METLNTVTPCPAQTAQQGFDYMQLNTVKHMGKKFCQTLKNLNTDRYIEMITHSTAATKVRNNSYPSTA